MRLSKLYMRKSLLHNFSNFLGVNLLLLLGNLVLDCLRHLHNELHLARLGLWRLGCDQACILCFLGLLFGISASSPSISQPNSLVRENLDLWRLMT